MPMVDSGMGVFASMYDNAPELRGLETAKWDTAGFTPSGAPGDAIGGFMLPGVSPLAEDVRSKMSGPPGQINLKELSRWYQEKNLEMKKHTPDEWRQTLDFIKSRSSNRSGSSIGARESSTSNRLKTQSHLGEHQDLVRGAFTDHMNEVATWKRKLAEVRKKALRSLQLLEGNIAKLEGWIAARTEWPLKVNGMCQKFRDQRIGIDLVMDEVEIELGKELEMLRNVATDKPNEKLQMGYDAKASLQMLIEELRLEIEKKGRALKIDTRMSKLKPSMDLEAKLDTIKLRPQSAMDVETVRERTAELLERAEQVIDEVEVLRDEMVAAAENSETIVIKYAGDVDEKLDAKKNASTEAREKVFSLLLETKQELQAATNEVRMLERAIDEKGMPLSHNTTRLAERRLRPPEEKTIDTVHDALVQEAAELDGAVSALQAELNINLANMEDLKRMEAMLEEDFGIKKITETIETRCVKARSFLHPDADKYVVERMLADDSFFEIMTR